VSFRPLPFQGCPAAVSRVADRVERPGLSKLVYPGTGGVVLGLLLSLGEDSMFLVYRNQVINFAKRGLMKIASWGDWPCNNDNISPLGAERGQVR